jgi:hypothetical protein
VAAAKDRTLTVERLLTIPAVMLLLSLQGIHTSFGASALAAQAWAAGALLAAGASFTLASRERASILRGSWPPMAAMLAMFFIKNGVAQLAGWSPSLRHEAALVPAVCALYGVLSGLFLGQMLRSLLAAALTPAAKAA